MSEEWIFNVAQNGVAIAVLIWIVWLGNKQMQQMYNDHNDRTTKLIEHLMADNQRLSDTLITCIGSLNRRSGEP